VGSGASSSAAAGAKADDGEVVGAASPAAFAEGSEGPA
jgi:hypothetical protein